jgi:hypothetical protein
MKNKISGVPFFRNMKLPIAILLLCVGLLLIACESKKEKAFRLLTNDSEAYWEVKSASCKKGKIPPFKHKLVLSFSTDSFYEEYWWHGDFYSTDEYYENLYPERKLNSDLIYINPDENKWKLLNENLLSIEGDTVRILALNNDTLKLNYPSENCNIRTFVRMKNTHTIKR